MQRWERLNREKKAWLEAHASTYGILCGTHSWQSQKFNQALDDDD